MRYNRVCFQVYDHGIQIFFVLEIFLNTTQNGERGVSTFY